VTVVVYVARTDLGTRRFATAIAAIGAPPTDPQQIATAQLAARIAGAEREARRALETAQVISADRERLQARIITMESDLAELTRSVRRLTAEEAKLSVGSGGPMPETRSPSHQTTLPSLPMASATSLMQSRNPVPGWTAAPAPLQAAATESAKPTVPDRTAARRPEAGPELAAASPPLPRPAPTVAAAAPSPSPQPDAPAKQDSRSETKAADITATIPADESPLKVAFGVDLGPALTVARLRARWTKLSSERPELVKGLHPLISVRDTANGKPVEVRLLAGPMANVDGATAFCQALVSTQYLCRPSVFDGQRLAVR